MKLTKHTIPFQAEPNSVPFSQLMQLPVKVLQFGTGVLLRALPDYFIDKANKKEIFNGRIVVVKSTEGSNDSFAAQNGLYTICERGIENGAMVCTDSINAAIYDVLSARTQWKDILNYAASTDLKIIISNTTEVGLQLVDDSIYATPPISFPGKLLAFLLYRYEQLGGTPASGLIILPTELISDNGQLLKNIVLTLAQQHSLSSAFVDWVNNHNHFCNTLVDRIVPGKPSRQVHEELQVKLGYEDDLLTMSEVFRLWAIEGNEEIKNVLSFHQIDAGVKIVPSITVFKELKLRLLNGTHTFNCATAFLCGFDLTREAITNSVYGNFTNYLMHQEIAPAISFPIAASLKSEFANQVFERFCNPSIDHQWLSIAVQITSKMHQRNIPLLVHHYSHSNIAPIGMATGFAAYILFMKAVKKDGTTYYGNRGTISYEIKDSQVATFYEWWSTYDAATVAKRVCESKNWWGVDLTTLPNFLETVTKQLEAFIRDGVYETIVKLDHQLVVKP